MFTSDEKLVQECVFCGMAIDTETTFIGGDPLHAACAEELFSRSDFENVPDEYEQHQPAWPGNDDPFYD